MHISDVSFGRRIALARERRGLSRRALGDLIGRSAEWVRQVERGDRAVDRLSILLRLATVLNVADIAAFVDNAVPRHPPVPRPSLDTTALRDAVFALPGAPARSAGPASGAAGPAGPPRPGPESGGRPGEGAPAGALGEEVTRLWAQWRDSAEPYTRTLGRLPRVLHALRPPGAEVAAHAYRLACLLAGRLGEGTVALAAARSAVAAARDAGCACAAAAAMGAYAETLVRLGAAESAEAACATALSTVDGCSCGLRAAVTGRLHLTAARAATARHCAHAARQWLASAAGYARQPSPDDPRFAFSAQDVALHAVRVALRLGHLRDALRLSHRVDPDSVSGRAERSRGYLTLARLHARARNAPATLLALTKAERACAEEVRIDPFVRQAITDLLGRDDDALVRADVRALAARIGLA